MDKISPFDVMIDKVKEEKGAIENFEEIFGNTLFAETINILYRNEVRIKKEIEAIKKRVARDDTWLPIDTVPIEIPVLLSDGATITCGKKEKEWYDGGSKWNVIGVSGYEWEINFEPTHWMPMPEPPKNRGEIF